MSIGTAVVSSACGVVIGGGTAFLLKDIGDTKFSKSAFGMATTGALMVSLGGVGIASDIQRVEQPIISVEMPTPR